MVTIHKELTIFQLQTAIHWNVLDQTSNINMALGKEYAEEMLEVR